MFAQAVMIVEDPVHTLIMGPAVIMKIALASSSGSIIKMASKSATLSEKYKQLTPQLKR